MLRAIRLIGLAGPILLAAGCSDALDPVAHDSGLPTASLSTVARARVFVNDFERPGDDTPAGSWYDADDGFPPGTIHRTPSGYMSPSAYGSGILSAHRRFHARLRDNGCGATRFAVLCTGPFTRWGKPTSSNPDFPPGGYMTEVDIYLDVEWVAEGFGKMDYRFDWSSAINNAAGTHKRDFIFNVGTPLTAAEAQAAPGFYVNASTNGNRTGAFPQNPCPNPATPPNSCRTPVKITQSGWYTFRHTFRPRDFMGTDYLAVDFTVLRHNAVVANWSISVVPDDNMLTVGGDRYGWFVINEINDLAIDCSNLRPPRGGHPALRAPCAFEDDHDDDDDFDDDGQNGDQDDDDDNDGQHDNDDEDDDNDGHHDAIDPDDDNDGIEDDFDSQSTHEVQSLHVADLASGEEARHVLTTGPNTISVTAVLEDGEDLVMDLVNPLGAVIAGTTQAVGRAVLTVPGVVGDQTVRVRNLSAGRASSEVKLISSNRR